MSDTEDLTPDRGGAPRARWQVAVVAILFVGLLFADRRVRQFFGGFGRFTEEVTCCEAVTERDAEPRGDAMVPTTAAAAAAPMPPAVGPSSTVADGAVRTPAPGSRLRVALMDAMRPEVQRIMGSEVKFVVSVLRVRDGYAFFVGRPIHADGREFSPEEIARAFAGEVYDGISPTMAWLVRQGEAWTVRSLLINQSDVGYGDWCRDTTMRSLMGDGWACEVMAR